MLLPFGHYTYGAMSVRPSLRVEEIYDSNPDARGEGADIEADFITSLSPSLEVSSENRRVNFRTLYSMDSRYYSREGGRDYLAQRANASMEMELGRSSRLTVDDSLRITKESLDAVDTGIQTERTDTTSNTLTLGLSGRLTPRSTASLTLSDAILEFESPALIDTRTDSASLAWIYTLTTRLSVNTTYGYTRFTYDDEGADVEIHSLQIGISEEVSPTLSFYISGGVIYMDINEERYDWSASSGFTKEFRDSSLNLSYIRSVANTSGLSREVNIRNAGTANWTSTLSRTFDISIYGNISKNSSEPSGEVDTTSYSGEIRAGWRPYQWLALTLGYSRFQQWTGSGLGEDITRDRISMSVVLVPGEWRL